MVSKKLLKKAKEALFSRAVIVPSIEKRNEKAAASRKAAWRAQVYFDLMNTVVVSAMMHHCARREARQEVKQKV